MADFDREAIEHYNITARDIENVLRYVAILQGTDSRTYADITAGCYYGTSALLHEVIELRILLKRDRWLLIRSRQWIRKFLRGNEDAHVEGLKVEYVYLQRVIEEQLKEQIGLGALVRANTIRFDYDRLLESELPLPFLEPTAEEVSRAGRLLSELKKLCKERSPC
ncbi:MAG: hypothetical protein FJ014_03580 [Chloroflexi bacterium]|nr:hypothetical protein [Chloroflexota bacterium]